MDRPESWLAREERQVAVIAAALRIEGGWLFEQSVNADGRIVAAWVNPKTKLTRGQLEMIVIPPAFAPLPDAA